MSLGKYELRLLLLAIALSVLTRATAFVAPIFNVDDLWYWPVPFDLNT
jgi:hypothetical protein